MRAAPKKIEVRAIRAACRYRDSEGYPPAVREALRTRAQDALAEVTAAMGCQGAEDLMVAENLALIVSRTPRAKLRRGRDY